jgi:hypothetical protein
VSTFYVQSSPKPRGVVPPARIDMILPVRMHAGVQAIKAAYECSTEHLFNEEEFVHIVCHVQSSPKPHCAGAPKECVHVLSPRHAKSGGNLKLLDQL